MKNPPVSVGSVSMALDQLEAALLNPLDASAEAREQINTARVQAAQALLNGPALAKNGPESVQAKRCIELVIPYQRNEDPCETELLAQLSSGLAQGWNGLLAFLLCAPTWQVNGLPRIDATPLSFWPTYVAALLTVPHRIGSAGQAGLMGAHYLHQLRELVHLVEANKGSAAVQAALARYFELPDARVLAETPIDLQELLCLKAKLLALHSTEPTTEPTYVNNRSERRLRVAFVCTQLTDSREVRGMLPLIESLDRYRFEVLLRPLLEGPSLVEQDLLGRGYDLASLGEHAPSALQMLRDAECDVIVYSTQLLQADDAIGALIIGSPAPLNLSIDAAGVGFPVRDGDLVLSWDGVFSQPSRFAAFYRQLRLPFAGALPLSGQSLKAATREWSRESLGLSDEAVVYVSLSPFRAILPETATLWSRILKAVPNSKLILYSYDRDDSDETAPLSLYKLMEAALAQDGLPPSSLIIGNEVYESIADVGALLQMGHIYLDTTPNSMEEATRMALAQGKPVVCFAPQPGRNDHAASLLRQIGCPALVCTAAEDYVAQATRLGLDSDWREQTAKQIELGLASDTVQFDLVAFGEAWGGAIEVGFDEYFAKGPRAFRKSRNAIQVPPVDEIDAARLDTEALLEIGMQEEAARRVRTLLATAPANTELVALNRRMLELQERWPRLIESLHCAVEQQGAQSAHWFKLGRALQKMGQTDDAIYSFSTGLRITPENPEIWLELAGYAEQAGDTALIQEIGTILKGLNSDLPEVKSFLTKHE